MNVAQIFISLSSSRAYIALYLGAANARLCSNGARSPEATNI